MERKSIGVINLTTIEHGGRCEKEQPKVGPKGEGAGATESKDTESTEEIASSYKILSLLSAGYQLAEKPHFLLSVLRALRG
jgi:hypothetical protein